MNTKQIASLIGLGTGLAASSTASAAFQNLTIHPAMARMPKMIHRVGAMGIGSMVGYKVMESTYQSAEQILGFVQEHIDTAE